MRLPDLAIPLSQMDGDQLCELVDELEHDGWADSEQQIQAAVESFWTQWVSQQDTYARPFHTHFVDPNRSLNTLRTISYSTVVVVIPRYIPEKYVKAFAEQMIREQINTEED